MKKIIVMITVVLLAAGCSESTVTDCSGVACSVDLTPKYRTIEYSSIEDDYIIIDVRTVEEFKEGHVKGAVNIEDTSNVAYDKEEVIVVYCRSGNRSEAFALDLLDKGYKYVYDLGSIDNWQGDIVKSFY